MIPSFTIEPLTSAHDRGSFNSEDFALDRYLRELVTQDQHRRLTNCFVAIYPELRTIAGYYTLAATGLQLSDLPLDVSKRLPRYPLVPAVLIGRLAVDRCYRGQGLGASLLADASIRATRADPAVHSTVVDAKDESAATFYRHHGFRPLASRPMSLFLPLLGARAV